MQGFEGGFECANCALETVGKLLSKGVDEVFGIGGDTAFGGWEGGDKQDFREGVFWGAVEQWWQ